MWSNEKCFIFIGQVYHYLWYLMLQISSDTYLVKFHFRRLKCRTLRLLLPSLGEMESDMSCLNRRFFVFFFKPSHSVAKYHKSNGEFSSHLAVVLWKGLVWNLWGWFQREVPESSERYLSSYLPISSILLISLGAALFLYLYSTCARSAKCLWLFNFLSFYFTLNCGWVILTFLLCIQ